MTGTPWAFEDAAVLRPYMVWANLVYWAEWRRQKA